MGAIEVINVQVDASRVAAMEPNIWLGKLGAVLEPKEAIERIIFMPPLFVNVFCLPPRLRRLGLLRGTQAMSLLRPLRAASVFFAYPEMELGKLPWAVMHDRAEALLREGLGALARNSSATVLTTVLADHPRIHWESWPERGDLYHSVQTIRPDGDPVAALRQRRPHTSFGSAFAVDPEDSQPGLCLDAGSLRVAIHWDASSVSGEEFSGNPKIVWCPHVDPKARQSEPAVLLRGNAGVHAVVRTSACRPGMPRAALAVHRDDGGVELMAAEESVAPGIRIARHAFIL